MAASPDFEAFWARYPKKRAKQDAWKAWRALKPSAALMETMLNALQRQCGSYEWRKHQGQYIPYPATWLRGRRWEDEGVTTADLPAPPHWECPHDPPCAARYPCHIRRVLERAKRGEES